MLLAPECYKCHRTNIGMLSVYTIGTYYMCEDCTRQHEQDTGQVGVFFYLCGLRFMSREEYEALPNVEENSND